MNFDKINTKLPGLPIVSGPNVFLRSEYQKNAGISQPYALERLRRLASMGVVRRVRTRRNGKLVQAWEYLKKKKEVAA